MPRFIIKLDGEIGERYLEWSTIVDRPVTYGMPLEEFKEYYRDEYGKQGMWNLDERMKRVESKGTSELDDDLDGTLKHNRAGPDETFLTKEEIYQIYCVDRPQS